MKREEEIKEKAHFEATKFSVRYGYADIEKLLCNMAKWCDNNPINPWHERGDHPENMTYVLAYEHGRYIVMFYRNSMFENTDLEYYTTSVDRWMYIPGNTKIE